MAFDFPNSPSVGQRVTGVGGIVYVWDGVKWASNIGSVTAQSMGDIGRNLLHNPLFNVAQRGAGPFNVSPTITLDRWRIDFSLDALSINQSTFSDANRTTIGDEEATYYLGASVIGNAGAGSISLLSQAIENVRRLANKTITISFWASAGSGTPKVGVGLRQNFGTGGSPSATVDVNAIPVTLSTTLTRYSVTLVSPSIAGKTLGTNSDHFTRLGLFLSSGVSNNTVAGGIGVQTANIAFWGVQLEIGSVATPLEKPDPRYDLANCQRFYSAIYNLQSYNHGGAAGQGLSSAIAFPTMRSAPTVAYAGISYVNGSGIANLASSVNSVSTSWLVTAVGTSALIYNVLLSADL